MLSTLQIQYNSLNGYTTVRMFTDSLFGHTIPNPESKARRKLNPAQAQPTPSTRLAHGSHVHGLDRGTAYWTQYWPTSAPNIMASLDQILIDLDSESETEDLVLLYSLSRKRKKSKRSAYLGARSTRGEFLLTEEVPDNVFSGCFRLNRMQFD